MALRWETIFSALLRAQLEHLLSTLGRNVANVIFAPLAGCAYCIHAYELQCDALYVHFENLTPSLAQKRMEESTLIAMRDMRNPSLRSRRPRLDHTL